MSATLILLACAILVTAAGCWIVRSLAREAESLGEAGDTGSKDDPWRDVLRELDRTETENASHE